MDHVTVVEYAKQLLAAHGDRAEAEAAQKAARHESGGEYDKAASWRRVRVAIRELRTAHVS